MYISETYTNETKGYQFGESGVFEAWTDDKGKLFKGLQREYGRCISKVHIDTVKGVRTIGWVFEKRMKYDDERSNTPEDYYVRHVWVTLHEKKPEKHTTYHYADV